MKQLICKECGGPREVGRKLCRPCNLERLKRGMEGKPRYMWLKVCVACKKEFNAWRKIQTMCSSCYKDMNRIKASHICTNNYILFKQPGKTEHRHKAETLLGRKLQTNEVVHHLDENPKNNEVTNLIILTRQMHGRLHQYLDLQRVILEKSGNENIENCWNNLRVPMTTAWLETTSAKVIKLWEIGQSAAEPLSNGDGSETMHDAPVTDNAVGEDIVQTTTA